MSTSAFGGGSGPILLDNILCTGLEDRLFDCPHVGMEVNNCSHDQDVGIACMEGKSVNLSKMQYNSTTLLQ